MPNFDVQYDVPEQNESPIFFRSPASGKKALLVVRELRVIRL